MKHNLDLNLKMCEININMKNTQCLRGSVFNLRQQKSKSSPIHNRNERLHKILYYPRRINRLNSYIEMFGVDKDEDNE